MTTSRPCILFVDDEPMILAGLRNGLRKHRGRWDMVFAASGEAALAELAGAEGSPGREIAVVVSDMRMPTMDGCALLEEVRRRCPATGRILLTGYAEPTAMASVTLVAHEILHKPCPLATIVAALEAALARHPAFADGGLEPELPARAAH